MEYVNLDCLGSWVLPNNRAVDWIQAVGTLSAVVVSLFVTFVTLRHQSKVESIKRRDSRLQNMARAALFLSNVEHEVTRLRDAVANNDGKLPHLALTTTYTSVKEDYEAIRALMMRDLPNANVLALLSASSEVMQVLQYWFAEWLEGRRTDEFYAVMHRTRSLMGLYAQSLDDYQVAYAKDNRAKLELPLENEVESQQRRYKGR